MSSAKPKNIVELRQLLAEKFPGVRMEAGRAERLVDRWETGVPQVDFHLEGGLARGALTEIISKGARSGAALLVAAIARQGYMNGHWVALVDGKDSFDPAALENEELSRLLWVRCSNAKEAMKAIDLLLHDGTIPVVVLDLIQCPSQQTRRIPSSTWHRLARTVETTATVCAVFTPEPMVTTAEMRLQLQPGYSLDAIEAKREILLQQVTVVPAFASENKRRTGKRFNTAS